MTGLLRCMQSHRRKSWVQDDTSELAPSLLIPGGELSHDRVRRHEFERWDVLFQRRY